MQVIRSVVGMSTLATLLAITPALARPGGWGVPDWGRGDPTPVNRPAARRADSREGKIEVARFVAEGPGADALGHGHIIVAAKAGATSDERQSAVFEAAVVDQLAKIGYDTATAPAARGQIAGLVIIHDVVKPAEPPRKPVSGEAVVGVSNRGSMTAMAITVDLSKPRKALISTRLEAKIRDRSTGEPLWEGRATIITREGDSRWTTDAIATRLAAALFKDFPAHS